MFPRGFPWRWHLCPDTQVSDGAPVLIKRAEGSCATVGCSGVARVGYLLHLQTHHKASEPGHVRGGPLRARCVSLTFGGTCLSRRSPLSVRRDSSPPRKPACATVKWSPVVIRKSGSGALTSSACPGRSMLSFPVLMSQTFSVLSLLPLTSSLLSADHATWYTDPTWPRREVRYLDREVISYI